jgi:hypothetical protein
MMYANPLKPEIAAPMRLVSNSLNRLACGITRDVLEQLPAYVVRAERAVPVDLDGEVLVVALENPGDLQLQERIQFIANRELRIAVATRAAIDSLIETHYAPIEDTED